MKQRTQPEKSRNLFMIAVMFYLILYALCSVSFLTRFPFVHSDEAWLAGLTRDMRTCRSFGVTEHFFDLKPRVPHALKLLFHALQMGYMGLFGYNIQAVRLLSLTAGLVCLCLLFLTGTWMAGRRTGAGLMILASLDIQFIYASHFGRQEIILCAGILSCVLILLRCQGQPSCRQAGYLALITGISVGIHPNSFLCAAICGTVMAGSLIRRQAAVFPRSKSLEPFAPPEALDPPDPPEASDPLEASAPPDPPEASAHPAPPKPPEPRWNHRSRHDLLNGAAFLPLILYICVTGVLAGLFVGISFRFDSGFIPDYFRYGEQEFGLSATAGGRLPELFYFFQSIYARESGTYYIPDLRLELILLPVILIFLALAWLFLRGSEDGECRVWRDRTMVLLLSVAGLAAGMMIIGRYNQTSILFFLMLGWICAAQLALLFERPGRLLSAAFALIFLLWNGQGQIMPSLSAPSYTFYLEQLSGVVPREARVIANLNTEFYFDQGSLRDYRNLPYLDSLEALEQYIEDHKIQYICLTDELDYIYENRPYYNVIYGNADFIKHLKTYCETRCTLSGSFYNSQYGARIISVLHNRQYGTVTVYKVAAAPSSLSLSPGLNPESPLR